jgi:hypothetical protein
MASLTLNIQASNPSPGWQGQWSIDGLSVGNPIDVAGPGAKAVVDVGRRFLALFGQGNRPLADPEHLRAMGRSLSDAWLAPVRNALEPALNVPGPRHLILVGDDPALLDLPWELIEITPACRSAATPSGRSSGPPSRWVNHPGPGPARSECCSWRRPRSTSPSSTTSGKRT